MNLGGWELLLIFLVVLLIFGGTKLPKLARSLGQAQKEFKEGVAEGGKGLQTEETAAKEPGSGDSA